MFFLIEVRELVGGRLERVTRELSSESGRNVPCLHLGGSQIDENIHKVTELST